ncbi:MAG: 6-bladed beta-propeller, partial [Gemmatimonadota bacterium]
LREEVRIGDMDDPRYTLTWMRDVVIRPDGSMYVTQPSERTIKVYDRAGRFVRSIGRQGSGPGEFDNSVGEIGFVGDTLFAVSATNQLMHLFRPDGVHLRSFRLPHAVIDDPALYPAPFTLLLGRVLADGSILAYPRLGGTGERPPSPVLRVTREGRIINVIARRQVAGGTLRLRQGQGVLIMTLPFSTADITAVPPKGDALVLASGRPPTTQKDTSFSVSRIALNGATVFQRWIRYRPMPLERSQVDSMIVARVREAGRGRFNPQPIPDSATRQVPKFLPPVTAVVAGADGTTWIRREETGGPAAWLVLDSKGNPIAQLTLPRTFTLKAADATHVWATITDELDIPYVVRYRVVQR